MRHLSVPATRLIHEHIGTIMSVAYSRRPLQQIMRSHFQGESKYVRRALFEIPEGLAERALIELGLYIRVVDDAENVSSYFGKSAFGEVVQADGSRTPLLIREVANKIIHAERYEWKVFADVEPSVTCFAPESQRERFKWSEASINLVTLTGFCGSLMS